MSTLTLEEYLSLLSGLPRPTSQQIYNFVRFVASAHSWYKRLPYFMPGIPFHFFLDRSAGCERVVSWIGKVRVTPRADCGFHYSWIPTDEYRERFGYLAYSCNAGGGFSDVRFGGRIVSTDAIPTVLGPNGRLYGLPAEVLHAGTVRLTAVIHTQSAAHSRWDIRTAKADEAEKPTWPNESGGQATLEKIQARCREMRKSEFTGGQGLTDEFPISGYVDITGVDAELYALVAPEQRRQHREAEEAIKRVCAVVYDTPRF